MVDELLELTADRYRRRILFALSRSGSGARVSVPEEVHHGDEPRDRLHQKLVHVHLPKLEAGGLVEWDQDEGVVERGPDFTEVEPLLGFLRQYADEPQGRPERPIVDD